MKKIKLSKGKETIVDDADYAYLSQYKWYCNNGYAARTDYSSAKPISIKMHRLIMNAPKDMIIDHVDGNPLNNQRNNLRICTHAENMHNMKINRNNTSGYKGVGWHKGKNKWRARIELGNKQVFLGYFVNIEDAHAAYNKASIKYHGEFGRTK